MPQERVTDGIVEQFVEKSVSRCVHEIVEVVQVLQGIVKVRFVPLERVAEQMMVELIPQIVEESDREFKSVPRDCISEMLYEQIVAVSFPPVVEQLVEVPRILKGP